MKIIILGAGQVGGTLAEHLADEQNDITVVDSQPATLRALAERLDIRTVQGDAAHPSTLLNAGAKDADMIIAVTNSSPVMSRSRSTVHQQKFLAFDRQITCCMQTRCSRPGPFQLT